MGVELLCQGVYGSRMAIHSLVFDNSNSNQYYFKVFILYFAFHFKDNIVDNSFDWNHIIYSNEHI